MVMIWRGKFSHPEGTSSLLDRAVLKVGGGGAVSPAAIKRPPRGEGGGVHGTKGRKEGIKTTENEWANAGYTKGRGGGGKLLDSATYQKEMNTLLMGIGRKTPKSEVGVSDYRTRLSVLLRRKRDQQHLKGKNGNFLTVEMRERSHREGEGRPTTTRRTTHKNEKSQSGSKRRPETPEFGLDEDARRKGCKVLADFEGDGGQNRRWGLGEASFSDGRGKGRVWKRGFSTFSKENDSRRLWGSVLPKPEYGEP